MIKISLIGLTQFEQVELDFYNTNEQFLDSSILVTKFEE